jgi:hypothetical protein
VLRSPIAGGRGFAALMRFSPHPGPAAG